MAFLRRLLPLRSNDKLLNRCYSLRPEIIQFSEEVAEARMANRPLVALESTIITHGMPYPQNLETAMQVEDIIRERGATPATVAIIAGQLHVGLSSQQLQHLAQAQGAVKASRRDLAAVVAGQLDGATTVAGTIVAAELADIPVFVTGGIGGVHRGGQETFDISADLTELGRSRTLVVCSGVKSILDIGRTLEYLETQGVCVCAFGPTHDFPAFYTRRSGHRAPHRVADAAHAARLAHASHTLRLRSGIVVAVPLPEEHAMDEKLINSAIEGALADAKSQGVSGKEVTPFILAAVSKATAGASLAANIALIKNNAGVGADIACELNSLRNDRNLRNGSNIGVTKGVPPRSRGIHTSCAAHRSSAEGDGQLLRRDPSANGPLLVIGGANIDRTYRVAEEHVKLDGSTHACAAGACGGGVARNMAEALWRMRGPGSVRLLTAVGGDADGSHLRDIAEGLLLDGCVVKGGRTANYASVMDAKGECLIGFGDMELHNQITMELVDKHIEVLKRSPLVVLDGNAPQETVDYVVGICRRMDKPVFFEPTDRRKATKILHSNSPISFASPNINELRAMADAVKPNHRIDITNDFDEIIKLSKVVAQVIGYILVTVGPEGIIVVTDDKAKHYPVEPIKNIVNVSGAGDCFSSGFIHGMLTGVEDARCISLGFKAAAQALATKNSVPDFFVELNSDSVAYSRAL